MENEKLVPQERKSLSHKMFTIWDAKGRAFDTAILVQRTTEEALRSFQSIVKNPETMLGKYPEDYFLYELGEFDQHTASFFLYPAPVNLGSAAQYSTPNGNVEKIKGVK